MDLIAFDPDGVGQDNGNYFGLPFTAEDSRLVLISAPWDVTASYGGGTHYGPDAIIEASTQLDLYDSFAPNAWRKGIGTAEIDYSIQDMSMNLRPDAKRVMDMLEKGARTSDEALKRKIERINAASAELNAKIHAQASEWLSRGKIVGLVGGDHSTPYGLIGAVGEKVGSFGILHLDAHCDLRRAYEGFTFSHASIMYNVLNDMDCVERIVQVGIRDYCDAEAALAAASPRVELFDDDTLSSNRSRGITWHEQCRTIVEALPEQVYVSFDIDSLSAELCPNTGTPVPGGLSFNEAVYLLRSVADSGRRIVGFDLCEVAPGKEGQWDANVGARVLYKLCCCTLKNER